MCEELSLQLSSAGWKVLETSHQPLRPIRLVDILWSVFFWQKNYDVASVDVYSGLAFLWAEVAVRILNLLHKPTILVLRGGGLADFADRDPVRIRNLLRRAEVVVTPSLFLKSSLQKCFPDIRYLPNAVDTDKYKFQIRERDNQAPTLIWIRAFHQIYQPEMAVRVVALLAKEFENIRLIMIGPDKKDGSIDSALAIAKGLGVENQIRVVGPIAKSDVPSWLAKGDIFLNTTRLESFGVSVLEAALIGLPIVSTNVGELPFLWENEQTAMLVSPNDYEGMADAVKRILTEPGLAQRLSQNARNKAEQFDWSAILPMWEDLFEEILNA